MEVIQEVGSYAGFAAVVGLAVLSALYFSQARDVRRLREWAGRAPERAAEQVVPGVTASEQAAQEATRPAPTGAVKPIPAAKAAPGAAAKPGAPQPAAPKPGPPGAAPPVPATAAANSGQAVPGKPAPVPAAAGAAQAPPAAGKPGEPATEVSPGPGPATPAAKPGAPPAPAAKPAPAAPGQGKPPIVAPARPSLPGRAPGAPAPRPAAASSASQATAVLPASQRLREPAKPARAGGQRLPTRYLALIVAGVIVIGGGAVFGITQLGGDDGGSGGEESAESPPESTAPVNPSTVTVSVLNGTTVPGLAAQIGDEVESGGFQRGNVANAIDQQRAESVVLYAEGADREARLVARKLGISQIEPVDPDSQALAGNASVVVIVGGDRTQ